MSVSVQITDVTLRDGLQMEPLLPVEDKIALFSYLSACGYSRLEITSFSHPKWMPQFADSEAMCKAIFSDKATLTSLPETMAFVPNEKGLTRLLAFPIPWVSAFIAASETFNQKNVNSSIEETLSELKKIVSLSHAQKRKVRIYISTVFGCPFEGKIDPGKLKAVFDKVVALGPDEIALSDTIGVTHPSQVAQITRDLIKIFPVEKTALHLHNTYSTAQASAMAALNLGIYQFDGSTGSIGGCPYAKGATGNVSAEELGYLFYREGRLPEFPQEALLKTLQFLKKKGMRVQSRILDILEKGGTLYGIH